jgi:hypothetical protein
MVIVRRLGLLSIGLFFLTALPASGGFAHARPKTDVCHFDKDSGTWTLISIGDPAVNAHLRNHDDALPDGVTTHSHTNLDDRCQPVRYVCPDSDQAGFGLDINFTDTSGDLHCSYPVFSGEDPNDFFCVYNPETGELIQDHDAGLCRNPAKLVE